MNLQCKNWKCSENGIFFSILLIIFQFLKLTGQVSDSYKTIPSEFVEFNNTPKVPLTSKNEDINISIL